MNFYIRYGVEKGTERTYFCFAEKQIKICFIDSVFCTLPGLGKAKSISYLICCGEKRDLLILVLQQPLFT